MYDRRSIECGENDQDSSESIATTMHKRRKFQRQACLLSVLVAFAIGLSLGVFVPVISLGAAISSEFGVDESVPKPLASSTIDDASYTLNINDAVDGNIRKNNDDIPDVQFPTIYDLRHIENTNVKDSYSVSFLSDDSRRLMSDQNKMASSDIRQPAFAAAAGDSMMIKNADANTLERTPDGISQFNDKLLHHTKPLHSLLNKARNSGNKFISVEFVGLPNEQFASIDNNPFNVIDDNIFWGSIIETALPKGFNDQDTSDWNEYVRNNQIVKLEPGCGRMQNRMVTFQDGKRACVRYRQNTDQIQGELFSFYLGKLLKLSNLAPSVASVIDLNSNTWSAASEDIANAQWKSQRPVVLTNWIPNLSAANIPAPFQPLERHLNKFDVRNITLGLDVPKPPKTMLDHLSRSKANEQQQVLLQHPSATRLNATVLRKFIELAQWSDLIVFDYLIANLDRVVNNLYNFQWNADIMAAPAHNLARQSHSQLLVFLDNESGLLHGYRLLKKYEAYHGLLLDNLCVFRRPTIEALQQLREHGVAHSLQQQFEQSSSDKVRDVLPSLPDKSIKILVDRIDRVLGQVDKCRELYANR